MEKINAKPQSKSNAGFILDPRIRQMLQETSALLKNAELDASVSQINDLLTDLSKNRFSVAVVGEFSRGKSSFINRLFDRDFLPVANSPTTAMLTRIRYNPSDSLIITDPSGKNRTVLPLSEDSWDGFVADIDGNEPGGVAFVGLPSDWLKKGIEIIDTPGAGDLEEKRTKIIGDALRGSDGAIITISAEQALSMSEKLFIEERLITKKVPFLMLIITKLDRIPEEQRAGIVDYVKTKLEMWKYDIPVYVPSDVKIPGSKDYSAIVGMDKVKNQIDKWIVDPMRTNLTLQWISLKVISILNSAINLLSEKQMLANADTAEKDELLANKKALLSKAENEWENLKIQMLERSNSCCKNMNRKISDMTNTLTERMQYELSRCGNPQKWWNQDFPYRMKIELTNLATSIENSTSSKFSEDSRWFNAMLERNFHTNVLVSHHSVIDQQQDFSNINADSTFEIKDLSKIRNATKIGLSALTIAGYALCCSVGALPIIATTGVSTVGSIASEGLFKKKIDEQVETLRLELQKRVPEIIRDATKSSEGRVKSLYDNVIQEATKQENKWLEAQHKAIEESSSTDVKTSESTDFEALISSLKNLCEKYGEFIIN